jgi:hypothetical protein
MQKPNLPQDIFIPAKENLHQNQFKTNLKLLYDVKLKLSTR